MKKIFPLFILTFSITLHSFAQFAGQGNMLSAQSNFSQYLNKTLVKNSAGTEKSAVITAFNNEENTIGSRFLFNEWVEGDSIVNAQGVLINTVGFIFNFDKITGSLLASQDKINNMLVASSGIQSFVLKGIGKRFSFQHVAAIDSAHFFLSLVKTDDKYSLYKRFKTVYIPSNFSSEGIIQTGNDYNEYKDEHKFYVVDEVTNSASELDFKAKNIKDVFAAEKDKVNAYFKQHRDDEINEKFLVGLVAYLNQ